MYYRKSMTKESVSKAISLHQFEAFCDVFISFVTEFVYKNGNTDGHTVEIALVSFMSLVIN